MIVFVSNFINHHQVEVADQIYNHLNGDYRFIETIKMPESFKKTGYPDYSHKPYVVRIWEDESQRLKGINYIMESDVVIFGGGIDVIRMVKERISLGRLTFQMSERWLKKGFINLLSPNLIRESLVYWVYGWRNKPVYRLCMSAYAVNDLYFLHQYKNRCYKWGYFTKVDDHFKLEAPCFGASSSEITQLMWCARFLSLKHPELPVQLALRLKKKGYMFRIDMFGSGEELDRTKKLAKELAVDDFVHFYGNRPNDEILKEMRQHRIFLFTSDRNEGWGAVLNEAMANGCVPIATETIGSVPFLIQDGKNGFIFKETDLDSLEEKVEALLICPNRISEMSVESIKTMQNIWSPHIAAERLVQLIESLKRGEDTPFKNGPCSKAFPI